MVLWNVVPILHNSVRVCILLYLKPCSFQNDNNEPITNLLTSRSDRLLAVQLVICSVVRDIRSRSATWTDGMPTAVKNLSCMSFSPRWLDPSWYWMGMRFVTRLRNSSTSYASRIWCTSSFNHSKFYLMKILVCLSELLYHVCRTVTDTSKV